MLRFFFILGFSLLTLFASAQSSDFIGKITNKISGLPVPECHVFIPGSSFQAFSDSSGYFKLSNIPLGRWQIVAVLSGFEFQQDSVLLLPDKTTSKEIRLNPIQGISPVLTVLSEGKRKNLEKEFLKVFLGKNFNDLEISLLNPYKLIFEISPDKTTTVAAEGPIFFKNDLTGYLISLYFKPLKLEDTNQDITRIASYYELPAEDNSILTQRRATRLDIYKNSLEFNLSELMSGETSAFSPSPDPKVAIGDNPGEYLLAFSHPASVNLSNGKIGTIDFSEENLALRINGSPIDYSSLILGGNFSNANPVFGIPINFNGDKTIRLANLERNAQVMQERIFLHTDRQHYWHQEHLLFKAYIRYGSPLISEDMSKVLHVELLDTRGNVQLHSLFKIENGTASGSILLPDSLSQNNYLLRSYTAWSSNYDKDGDFFKPIQILERSLKPVTQNPESASAGITVFTDKQSYGPDESVRLNIMASDSKGKPINANLSVTVLDLNQASVLPEQADLKSSLQIINTTQDKSTFERHIESGFLIKGSLFTPEGTPIMGNVTALIDGFENIKKLKSEKDGSFIFPQANFEEKFEIAIQATSQEGFPIKNIKIELIRYPSSYLPSEFDFSPFATRSIKPLNRAEIEEGMEIGEILLEEAVVEKERESTIGPMPYGSPDNVVKAEDLTLNGNVNQFLNSLAGKIPGMQVFGTPTTVKFRGGEPLVLINGVPASLAGVPVINVLGQINIFSIDRVEVVKRLVPSLGDQGRNGVISIILKTGEDLERAREANLNSFTLFELQGLQVNESFEDLMLNQQQNPWTMDQKPTLYWNPNFVTNESNLSKSVEFKTNSKAGPMWVEIQGISESGEPVFGKFLINESPSKD